MEGLNSSQGDTGDTLGADAESSGADATLVKRPRSAPRSSNNFAASTWPFSHAIDSAVRPFATPSTSAPPSRSSRAQVGLAAAPMIQHGSSSATDLHGDPCDECCHYVTENNLDFDEACWNVGGVAYGE